MNDSRGMCHRWAFGVDKFIGLLGVKHMPPSIAGMQCVNVNVIRREFVLARHIPDCEDIVHQRRGNELGGEQGRA